MARQTRRLPAAEPSDAPSPAEWAARVRRLESEVAGLRRAMRTRGLIEQAKGVLAERLGIDPEESFDYLSRLSQHQNVSVVDVAADVLAHRPLPADPGPSPTDPDPALARRVLRAAARVTATQSTVELAEAVAEAVGDGVAVCVYALEPDGGLAMLSAHGWAPGLVADWRHVPSSVPTPATTAVRLGRPLWIDGPPAGDLLLVGDQARRAALPLTTGSGVVGVLELAWPRPEPFDDVTRRHLVAVAATVARRVPGTEPAEPDEEPSVVDGRWVEAVLDGLATPAQLLAPVYDDEGATVTDFTLAYTNAAAFESAGLRHDAIGRRLVDLNPGLADSGVFAGYVRAYERGVPLSGEPREEILGGRRTSVRRQATRLGNRLLATWHEVDTDARPVRHLDHMETLGGLGWADWDLVSGEVYWSPGLYRLLGRDPARGPVPPGRLPSLVIAEDLATAEAGRQRVLRDGAEASEEIRLICADGIRTVRVVAAPRHDGRGRPIGLSALVQDLTEHRRREAELNRTGQQLAAQRIRLAAEQAHTDELRRLLYPPPERTVEAGRLRLFARHLAPKSIDRFRGDFYDIIPTDDGVVITLGDVFGSGAAAATAVARLRHAARVLCLPDMAPARILSLLNQDLNRDDQPPMASLVVASFGQDSVRWAQAGHFAPILLRGGRGRSLPRPGGLALGLTRDAVYDEGRLALRPGDTMVFFTDGLIGSPEAGGDPVQHLVRGFGRAWRQGGPGAILDGFLRPAEDEACVVAVELTEVG